MSIYEELEELEELDEFEKLNKANQVEFHSKLEVWAGSDSSECKGLQWISGIRIQCGYVVLSVINSDYYGDNDEFAISLDELVKQHGDYIKFSHPQTAEEDKPPMIESLRNAITAIELQQSTYSKLSGN